MPDSTPPLYGSTFTLHRVSPLRTSDSVDFLSKASLQDHSRRFANALRGNILRGVHVGLGENEGLPRAGSLRRCQWSFLKPGAVSSSQEEEDEEKSETGPDGLGLTEGIQVKLEYDRATYYALLVRGPSVSTTCRKGEWCLPLLLSKMPTGLRSVLLDYIAATFDTRAEPLLLNDGLIGEALEGFVDEASRTGRGLSDSIRDIQLSLGIGGLAHKSLRSVDVTLKREDLAGFFEQGQKLPRKDTRDSRGPFMRGVDQFLSNHLALDRSHLGVHISRVACATFALGSEGRVKIFAPSLSEDADLTPQEASVRKGITRLIHLLLRAAIGDLSGSLW